MPTVRDLTHLVALLLLLVTLWCASLAMRVLLLLFLAFGLAPTWMGWLL